MRHIDTALIQQETNGMYKKSDGLKLCITLAGGKAQCACSPNSV